MKSQAVVCSSVLCYGEILWDALPHGRFPGGATLNVAYHLQRQGLQPLLVSAIGCDADGDALLQRLESWGLDIRAIKRTAKWPTGTVRAMLSPEGDALYEIANDVAWDHISLVENVIHACDGVQAVVFGSLAQRSAYNRRTLDMLLELLPTEGERVFDVNLRSPHDDLALACSLAGHATLLKVNAEEAAWLCGDRAAAWHPEAQAQWLAEEFRLATVCITAGREGAGMLHQEQWFWEPAAPAAGGDTIGAGDAFLAALIAARMRDLEPAAALARACRLGEFVASCEGATPDYDANWDYHVI